MSLFQLSQKYYAMSDGGYNVNTGLYEKGDWEEYDFRGTVQSLKDKELENFDVAMKEKGMIRVYSTTALPIITSGIETSLGALVLHNNRYYKLIIEEKWDNGIINHYKYFGVYYKDSLT